jgi:TonB family protein
MTRVTALVLLAAALAAPAWVAASPLEDFGVDLRRSEGIMVYRVVADSSVHRPELQFFATDREVASAAVEGDLRERWLALLSSGFEPGGDCAPVCLQCDERVRYRLQFPPLADSFLVAVLWDDHRALLVRGGRMIGHRTLTAVDTAWATLLRATFPDDHLTQMLRATDPGPRPTNWGPNEVVFVDELPEVLRRVEPHYPPRPLMRGESGLVMVQALVGPKGRILDIRIKSPPSDFDEPARVAVEGWRFKPARCGGTAIPVWVAIPIRFTFNVPGSR